MSCSPTVDVHKGHCLVERLHVRRPFQRHCRSGVKLQQQHRTAASSRPQPSTCRCLSQQTAAQTVETDRRHILIAAATAAVASGWLGSCQQGSALQLPWDSPPSNGTSPSRRLRPELASAFTKSVYDALLQQEGLSETDLQMEIYRLKDREYPYYRTANAAALPSVPDLSDASGGLSNPVFFNFVYYILWKVAARHVKDEMQRNALTRLTGQLLAAQIAPGPLQTARKSAAANGGIATPAQLQQAVSDTLQILKQGGFIDDFRIVWGATPNLPARPYGEPTFPQPEEAAAGADSSEAASGTASDTGSVSIFQVTLRGPADIQGSVSLRGEEDGWWGRAESSLLAAVLAAGGHPDATTDEFFFQDQWQGPKALADKALLFFGDPLQTVEVPWVPTSLIQDWRL